MTEPTRAPIWFWIAGAIALIWNGLGLLAYFQQILMSAQEFAALPQQQRDMMVNQPSWVMAAFAVAVFSGFVAAIALLLRKRVAVRLFLLSLLAVIVQFSSYFIIDGYLEFIAGQGWAMPILIIIFAVGFAWIAWRAEQQGRLR